MKKHVRMIAFLILSICLTSCSTADASTGPDMKQNIECANDYEAVVTEKVVEGMIFSYVLEQDALETRLCIDYDGAEIRVSTSNGDLIQKIEIDLTVDSAGNYIGFIDFNRDSYVDIQLSSGGGVLNENYLIYLWDNDCEEYVPLIYDCKEPLSYYEVYDGYVKNWVKGGASSVLVQTLVWTDKHTLSLKSESDIELEN